MKLPSVFLEDSALKRYQTEVHISKDFENTAHDVTLGTEKCNKPTHFSQQAHDALSYKS